MTEEYLNAYNLRNGLPSKFLSGLMLAAVRGPDDTYDVNATEVKYELTGRIRAILFRNYPGVHTTYPIEAGGVSNVKKAIDNLPNSFFHFLTHIEQALFVCQDEPVWGGYGKELYEYLANYTRKEVN